MSTFTNLAEPENILDLSFFGRLELLFQPDGTTDVRCSGHDFWFNGADDEIGLDAVISGVKGRLYR